MPLSHVSSAILRGAEREPATLPISLILRSETRLTRHEATMINISLGGACVQTYLELVPGDWVGIIPKGEFPHAIPSRVVWVRPKDAAGLFYLVGLQFIDTLPV